MYCDPVKNITVSVDDEVYRLARIRAAENDRSVSSMVREFLCSLIGGESDFERRKRLERETLAKITAFTASDRLTREEVHDRHAVH